MKIDGRFWLTKDGQSFLGSGRIELLNKIQKTGSIHAAAKEIKMSYKAAWERINSMNNLADEPLITRTIGGKGGGGTVLTPYAHKLIETYNRFNELHRQFINRFAEAGDNPEKLARILSRTFLTTSARNQIPSKIGKIEFHGLNAKLSLSISGGVMLTSNITAKSAKNMGLTEGSDMYAIIKSSDITLTKELPVTANDDINILEGVINSVENSEEFIEIGFSLNENTTLIALLNKSSNNTFQVGEKAYALISANNIIIGS
ncbi:MAG: TOBE domain-containing protein [Campylobacterales bacterium]|nr:TOBE domain-containing protein [Campylobacterales bacterium]